MVSGVKTKLFAIPPDTSSFSSFPLSLLSSLSHLRFMGFVETLLNFCFPHLGLRFKPEIQGWVFTGFARRGGGSWQG